MTDTTFASCFFCVGLDGYCYQYAELWDGDGRDQYIWECWYPASPWIDQEAILPNPALLEMLDRLLPPATSLVCMHEWVDTGFRKTWCKHCNADGEF